MFQGLQEDQLAGALEAMLFVTDEPVGTIALAEMLECEVGAVEAALVRLRDDLEARGSGIQLREVAGGWRLFTHPAYHELIEKYVLSWDTRKLSAAAMETLAIVAYTQPVTRAGVASVRGVNSDSSINSLVEKGLVREVEAAAIAAGRAKIEDDEAAEAAGDGADTGAARIAVPGAAADALGTADADAMFACAIASTLGVVDKIDFDSLVFETDDE